MTIKIVFNNQTHRISKHPLDYATLLQKVTEIFGNQLPQTWTLQYLDSDEDKIMLSNQEDYKTLLEEEIGSSSKSVKIFVLPLEGKMNQSQVKVEEFPAIIQPEAEAEVEVEKKEEQEIVQEVAEKQEKIIEDEDNFSVIESQGSVQEDKKEEPVVENVIQQEKIEEPVVEEKLVIEEQAKVEPQQEEVNKESQVKLEDQDPLGKILVNFLRPQKTFAQKQEKLHAKLNKFQQKFQQKLAPELQQKVQQKKQKIQERFAEKQAKKKNELRAVVTEVIHEQLPIIASLTKEFIQENRQAPIIENNTSIHRTVRCDGCHAFPIVGIRYKCYVCPNFDYCEKCEATKEHSHPFIKFKQPQEQGSNFFRNRGPCFGRVQPEPEMKDFSHPFGFIRCMNKMNETLNSQKSQAQAQAQAQAKAQAQAIAIAQAQAQAEAIVKRAAEFVIEEIKPEPVVANKAEVLIEEVKAEPVINKKEEVLIEEVKPEEIKKEKEYDTKTHEKAGKLKEMFKELSMTDLLEFVSQVPDLSLEDLIGSYQGL